MRFILRLFLGSGANSPYGRNLVPFGGNRKGVGLLFAAGIISRPGSDIALTNVIHDFLRKSSRPTSVSARRFMWRAPF